MKAKYKALIFISSFALGLILPVQSLMLIAHGCTLKTLGIAIGACAFAVISAEVPTGFFADLYGRKTSFILACALSVVSCAVLLFSKSFAAAVAGLVLMGLGTAFASGSADALIIEETIAQSGKDCLGKAVGAMRAYECAGLMTGAVAGGFLPGVKGYEIHIVVRMALAAVTGVWAWFAMRESHDSKRSVKSIRTHLSGLNRMLITQKDIPLIITCIAALGFAQFMLETYWQPQMTALAGGKSQTLLGVLCSAGFGAAAVGCSVAGHVKTMKQKSYWAVYLSFGIAMSVLMAFLSVQSQAVGFVTVYIVLYLVIGIITVAEQTIVNTLITDDVRASVLSLTSFAARAGGVVSSVAGAAMLTTGASIGTVWIVGSAASAACLAAAGFARLIRKRVKERVKGTGV